MKVSIDTYCRPQQASKSSNLYLSQAPVGLLLEYDPIDCVLTWNLSSRVYASAMISRFALVAVNTAVKIVVSCIISRQTGVYLCLPEVYTMRK